MVEYFITKYGIFDVNLECNDVNVGTARFETFKEQDGDEEYLAAEGYPHVKNNCLVCNDTHED